VLRAVEGEGPMATASRVDELPAFLIGLLEAAGEAA
jgi:hypothetical protein